MWGIQGPGLLVVGALVAWAGLGWMEVDGGEDSYPKPRLVSRHWACLIAFSFQVAQRKNGIGRRHTRPLRLYSFSSTLPHLTESASQSAISHLLHTLCAQISVVLSDHCRLNNHCLPLTTLADTQTPQLLGGSWSPEASSEAWDLEPRYLGEMPWET